MAPTTAHSGSVPAYTEHVTRVLVEDREHEGIGTIAVLTFAPPEGESRPATLGPQSLENVDSALTEALARAEAGEIQAIALTGTGRVFLAGADLSMFADPAGREAVDPMTHRAHDLQVRMRGAAVPVLAHLNGAALGGGLEVALMADIRTAGPTVRGIGLPETSLGILPGWGGTTLLQSVIDPADAVRVILEDPARDKQLSASAAHELGIVEALVEDLDAALDHLAGRIADGGIDPSARPDPIPAAGSDRARTLLDALDAPHSPAETRRAWAERMEAAGAPSLKRTLGILEALPGSSLEQSLAAEHQAIVGLADSDAAAGSLYAAELLRRGKPGRRPVEGAREIRRVGVAGAGLMASQIAAQLALGLQVPVTLRDLDEDIARKGLAHARDVIAQAASRGKLDEQSARSVSELLNATADVADLADCDLVLEAVPEVLAIKKSVLGELEGVLDPSALLVTNTSSLSVAAMSEDLAHPERVVGLHFFNPVAKMPLVEVVRTERTDPAVLATGHEVVRRCGKFAVESADAPGFIVNRLLFRVLSEVLRSADQGADLAAVDASLDPFGLPMRPFELLDLVGIGVADHVGKVLGEQLGTERFPVSTGLTRLLDSGEAGTVRDRSQVHPQVSDALRAAFSGGTLEGGSAAVGEALLDRVLRGLAEETGLMLDEGVVERAEQIDLAMILGAGYPRHRGGLTPYLDQTGVSREVVGAPFHGDRFTR
ncbi:enoyl-CoA hydratase/isomerase family protein [Brachybacterium halotolerans subsp. kimchii]|uniref:3-hydroxyacyl-CoA dehydrogenase NAD-binding domain-containing protein n=1 Tax=Brachybacterium halotolerans TaxID=2795215 RepID=UPI001E5452C3|nr:3-hydroxyacyl-CoA dehydrogenase NAD-binding domain-containing protein [Brachybacterium halotolerans]UEJ81708.1 enoyl-CoA hydratase/isomerase family protein [Brachybacterium halotolerans subsp. kimchii]